MLHARAFQLSVGLRISGHVEATRRGGFPHRDGSGGGHWGISLTCLSESTFNPKEINLLFLLSILVHFQENT